MLHLKTLGLTLSALLLAFSSVAQAASTSAMVYMSTETGNGMSVGTVTFTDTPAGLEIKTDLKGLPAGEHGFHVHEKGDCGPMEKDGKMTPALMAGGHFDPDKSGKHLGPDGDGHKGDLPKLVIGADGMAKLTLTLKKAKAEDFKGRALMIHGGGDNYSDMPAALGGGGPRIACGLIQ